MKKFLLFLKKSWKVLALIVGAIVGIVLFRGRVTNFVDDYRKIKDVHDEEVNAINKARSEELKAKEENKKTLEKTLKIVQEQYDADLEKLDSKKKKEIKKLVDAHGHDPVALADELTKVTGFRVILPEE